MVKQEDVKPRQLLATQYLPDIKLQAMEGEGDESLRIIRVVKGCDPCYDLTKGDDELKEACALITEDLLPSQHDEAEADDLSVVSVEMYDGIDFQEAKELLIKLVETKTKEAKILRELTVVVSADDLTPRKVGKITKGVVEQEVVWPEVKFITDEYDYQATRMILAAGHRMRQIYDRNMGEPVKVLSLENLAKKYNVNVTRLFEMLKGVKYGRQVKSAQGGSLFLDIDTV